MRKLLVGDMFCGAGGTSHGLVNSDFAEVAWAINHDPKCIEAHKKNHPDTVHYEEDIVSMDIERLTPVDLLWASLECTHFSQAKGGQSRNPDSRMLARQMYRYIRQTDPTFVVIENVKEFLSWGPLVPVERKNKLVLLPDKDRKGEFYREWVATIKAMGYDYEYSMINSADHGARTSRSRYFGVFVKRGYTISFPEATHSKDGKNGLPKWLPCRDYIDLENEGTSIFGRSHNDKLPKNLRRPLAENTLKRIAAGIKKFCLDGDLIYDRQFIAKYYGAKTGQYSSIDEPLHTIPTKDRHLLVSTEKEHFVAEHFGTNRPVDQPMPTIMAYKDQKYIVTIEKEKFTTQNYTQTREGNERADSLDKPLKTIPTGNIHSVVTVEKGKFISKGYTAARPNNIHVSSLDDPLHVIPTTNIHSLITMEKIQFIQQYFSSGGNPNQNQSLDDPLWSITTSPKAGLVTTEKTFNVLVDVKTRFLTADELMMIQGFSSDYELIGSQAVKKKAIGNSVVPLVAQKIIEELWMVNCQEIYAA